MISDSSFGPMLQIESSLHSLVGPTRGCVDFNCVEWYAWCLTMHRSFRPFAGGNIRVHSDLSIGVLERLKIVVRPIYRYRSPGGAIIGSSLYAPRVTQPIPGLCKLLERLSDQRTHCGKAGGDDSETGFCHRPDSNHGISPYPINSA